MGKNNKQSVQQPPSAPPQQSQKNSKNPQKSQSTLINQKETHTSSNKNVQNLRNYQSTKSTTGNVKKTSTKLPRNTTETDDDSDSGPDSQLLKHGFAAHDFDMDDDDQGSDGDDYPLDDLLNDDDDSDDDDDDHNKLDGEEDFPKTNLSSKDTNSKVAAKTVSSSLKAPVTSTKLSSKSTYVPPTLPSTTSSASSTKKQQQQSSVSSSSQPKQQIVKGKSQPEDDDDDEDDFDDGDDDEEESDEASDNENIKQPTSAKHSASQKKRGLLDSDSENEDKDDYVPKKGKASYAENEEDEDEEEDDDDDDDDDDDEVSDIMDDDFQGGDIEAAAARFEAKRARIAAEAEAEMRLNAMDQERFVLPSTEELEEERLAPPNMPNIRRRINDIIYVLTDFRNRRDINHSRSDYLECLSQDFADFYGYNRDLVDLFLQIFAPAEALQFFEANELQRPVTIRVNTLKTKRRDLMQALMNRGVNLGPTGPWTKIGLTVFESPVPIGATPEYLAGYYMLQSAASLVPVIALSPQPGEKVLDVASAPGGKTTHIAQLMNNQGVLVANDLKKDRIASLSANLARLGVTNSVICSMDGRKLPEMSKGFDRVLLDAPCTGLGVIARDPSARTTKTKEDVMKMSQLQKQLILAAIDCCDAHSKTGGIIVYSTCSIAIEENEAVVNYALRNRNVKLVPFTGDDNDETLGKPGLTSYASGNFHPDLVHTRRFYPHVHNMDGFFVAKLKKISNEIPKRTDSNSNNSSKNTTTLSSNNKSKIQPSKAGNYNNQQKNTNKYSNDDDDGNDTDNNNLDDDSDDYEKIHQNAAIHKKNKFSKTGNHNNNNNKNKPQQQQPKQYTQSSSITTATTLSSSSTTNNAPTNTNKTKRLPVEMTSTAEKEMMNQVTQSILSSSHSSKVQRQQVTSSSSTTASIGKSNTQDKDDNSDNEPLSSNGKTNPTTVSFLKAGERIGVKRKRKAGRKVREAKEARSAATAGTKRPANNSNPKQ